MASDLRRPAEGALTGTGVERYRAKREKNGSIPEELTSSNEDEDADVLDTVKAGGEQKSTLRKPSPSDKSSRRVVSEQSSGRQPLPEAHESGPDREEERLAHVRQSRASNSDLATSTDSDESFMVRRFGYLQARVLLEKQDKLRRLEEQLEKQDLRCLEEQLDARDRIAEQDLGQLTSRDEYDDERSKLMRTIESTYRDYASLLGAAHTLTSLGRVPEQKLSATTASSPPPPVTVDGVPNKTRPQPEQRERERKEWDDDPVKDVASRVLPRESVPEAYQVSLVKDVYGNGRPIRIWNRKEPDGEDTAPSLTTKALSLSHEADYLEDLSMREPDWSNIEESRDLLDSLTADNKKLLEKTRAADSAHSGAANSHEWSLETGNRTASATRDSITERKEAYVAPSSDHAPTRTDEEILSTMSKPARLSEQSLRPDTSPVGTANGDGEVGVQPHVPSLVEPKAMHRDAAALPETESSQKIQTKDMLATQIWKLYHKTRGDMPDSQRLDNFAWRMMSMRATSIAGRTVAKIPPISVTPELESLEEMRKNDPLGMQIWKLYHKSRGKMANSERMANLTWRMMSMNLQRGVSEQEWLVSRSGRPSPLSGIAQPRKSSELACEDDEDPMNLDDFTVPSPVGVVTIQPPQDDQEMTGPRRISHALTASNHSSVEQHVLEMVLEDDFLRDVDIDNLSPEDEDELTERIAAAYRARRQKDFRFTERSTGRNVFANYTRQGLMNEVEAPLSQQQQGRRSIARSRLYRPLDQARYETRMLEIQTHLSGNLVCCHLVTESLVRPPEYHALSYHWGNQKTTENVNVNGCIVEVTENLERALQELRRRRVRRVWVDALCIDQSNLYERATQVQHMGLIFSRAKAVIAWLGSEPAPEAIRAIEEQSKFEDDGQEDHSRVTKIDALNDLRSRPYWTRKWIIQELAKARSVEIWCGSLGAGPSATERFISAHADEHHESGTYGPLALLAAIARLREQERSLTPVRMRLSEALFTCRFSEASDPRDFLYALLGLTRDGGDLVPMPNYMETVTEVFTQAATNMMHRQGHTALVLLARHTDGGKTGLPSWVPDWSRLPQAKDLPCWLLAAVKKCIETPASPSWARDWTPAPVPADLEHVVTVRGEILGRIESIGCDGPKSTNPQDSELSLPAMIEQTSDPETSILGRVYDVIISCGCTHAEELHWMYSARKLVLVTSILTLSVVNNLDEHLAATDESCSIWREIGQMRVDGFSLLQYAQHYKSYTDRTAGWTSWLPQTWPPWAAPKARSLASREVDDPFLLAARNFANYGLLLAFTHERSLCAVPKESRMGDYVCQLEHCDIPMVLRRHDREGSEVYEYIGEAYAPSEMPYAPVNNDRRLFTLI